MTQPGSLTLLGLKVKAIKADLIAERVTLTLTADLDDQMASARATLQHFHTFDEKVDVTMQAQVTQLPIATFGPSKDEFA